MRPINNNYLSVDAKEVDKHDHHRAMYKWSNKENQKRMINPIVGASQRQMVRIYCDANS